MTKLCFFQEAWEDYLYWQKQDKKTLNKINQLLKDIVRNPYDGIGKPEPLLGIYLVFGAEELMQKIELFIVFKKTI